MNDAGKVESGAASAAAISSLSGESKQQATHQAAKPPISPYRNPMLDLIPDPKIYQSPFENAYNDELWAEHKAKQQREEVALQEARIAKLLAWAKQKGLVAADATELPDGDQQEVLLKQRPKGSRLF